MHQLYSSAATRELAERRSGTVEVLLLWHAERDQVEVSVFDWSTDAGFHIEVAPGDALDAFYHPYAYAPARRPRVHVVEAETVADDG
jgi:hypothetical protein